MSFYECLKAYPEGTASVSRLALTAKRLGYQGIIICNQDPNRIFRPDAADKIKGINLIIGVDVTAANTKALKNRLLSLRSKYPFLLVRGVTEEIVRAACEDPNVDLLLHPCNGRQPLSIAAARAAKMNQVAIGFDLSPMMFLSGSSRARWLEAIKRNLQMARKFKLALVITSGAKSQMDLKTPRDLFALANVADFEPDESKEALQRAGIIVELNKKKWLGPGVELV